MSIIRVNLSEPSKFLKTLAEKLDAGTVKLFAAICAIDVEPEAGPVELLCSRGSVVFGNGSLMIQWTRD